LKKWIAIFCLVQSACLSAGEAPESSPQETLQQDRVLFVVANTVFVLLHELGHALIHEFDFPVLGEEEDAADALATIILIGADILDEKKQYPYLAILLSAAEGQKLIWETGLEQTHIDQYYWARHSLSVRRYHRILCLIYGSDLQRFGGLPELTGMPEHRSDSCEAEYDLARRSMTTLGDQLRGGQPIGALKSVDVPIYEDETEDDLALTLVGILKDRAVIRRVINMVATIADLPPDMDVSIEDCEIPGAYWDPEDDTLIFCYQLLSTFYELSVGQKLPDFLREYEDGAGSRN
jgi:hypothetical protein